jgi:hypothetical protein
MQSSFGPQILNPQIHENPFNSFPEECLHEVTQKNKQKKNKINNLLFNKTLEKTKN